MTVQAFQRNGSINYFALKNYHCCDKGAMCAFLSRYGKNSYVKLGPWSESKFESPLTQPEKRLKIWLLSSFRSFYAPHALIFEKKKRN